MAMFSEDALQFSWQAQHFGRVHRHFAWPAQHFRRAVLRVFCESHCQGCVKWRQRANSVAGMAFCETCWKLDGRLARNIAFDVVNFEVHKKTRRKTSISKLQREKIGGCLARNARFDAPTCIVSSLWFSCGLAVSMEEAAKPILFQGAKTSCNVVLRGRRGTLWHSNLFDNMSKVVLCGMHNTFASFSEDELQFSSTSDVSHCLLFTAHSTLHTLHSILYTLHTTPYIPHYTLYSPHFTLYTLDPTLHTPHSTQYTPHSTLYTLHFTVRTPHFTLHTLHFKLYTPQFTLHTLHSTPNTWHFTLHTVHPTLYTRHSPLPTLHSTLYTLNSSLHTLHFTLLTPHFTRHTPHFTLHTPHFTLLTFHSTLYTLHSTLCTPPSSAFHSLQCTGTVTGKHVDCSNHLLHKSVLHDCIRVRGLHLVHVSSGQMAPHPPL